MKLKPNSLVDHFKGQNGDISVFMKNGEQITRSINREPKNPRTPKQMAQRVQYANLVRTFKVMATSLRGSYQEIPKIQSYYNHFLQTNLGHIKVYLTKEESKQKACVVAPYQISEGLLDPIQITTQADILLTSIRLPQAFTITPVTTVGQFSIALLSVNPSVRRGDQLTIVHNLQTLIEPTNIPRMSMRLHYVVINTESTDILYEQVPQSLYYVNNGYIATDANAEMGGIAYIWSRQDPNHPNKALLSPQSIVLTPGNTIYQKYSSETKKQEAIKSYGSTPVTNYSVPGSTGKQDEEDIYFSVTNVTLNGTFVPKGSGEFTLTAGNIFEIKGNKLTEVELNANILIGGPTTSPTTVALSAVGTITTTSDTLITISVTMNGKINHLLRADTSVIIYNFS
ncbi:hypothetical protein EZS27_011676 [termite gut metagenome]|uniref:Uncharacterized protein n=1 Tax=termite gut metagenome TaxID=433724 RepID=A0A5J4S4M6_9ZZZZ